MAMAYRIFVASKDPVWGREDIVGALADYHSALRAENARLRAQVEELLALRPVQIIIGKVEGR